MSFEVWRLSKRGTDNLGLSCSEDGLFLGQTALTGAQQRVFDRARVRANELGIRLEIIEY
jgi:hypothetical protein